AEDGIRHRNVTGVQTCALPISPARHCRRLERPSSTRPARWPRLTKMDAQADGSAGLVLAAGGGRRLGLGAKALLRSARETLVERERASGVGGKRRGHERGGGSK